jgi:hypothetical protein
MFLSRTFTLVMQFSDPGRECSRGTLWVLYSSL